MKVLDGDGQSRSRVELHLHLVGECRDDLQGIITRERNAGGLEFRTRARKVLDPKRGMVKRGSNRTLGGLSLAQNQKNAGQLQDFKRTTLHNLRAEEVNPDLLMGR